MRRTDSGKDPDAGKDWRQKEKGMTEDEMVGGHHWLDGHESEQSPGVGDGQGSLERCSPWGRAEHRRIDAFELWCWRRLLRVPWTAKRSNQSILNEISPGCSLERLMLKLKLQYFGHRMGRADSLEKTLMLWKQEEKGTTEGEMVGWHLWLEGHKFEQSPGVGDGQGSLACCSPWDCKESDTTKWLDWTYENRASLLEDSYD